MTGPAAATQIESRRGLRSARKLTGTGLAYPKRKAPEVAKYSISGIRIVPIGSMCLNGLKLTRPRRHAVSSPNNRATYPCEASWNVIAITKGMTQVEAV